MSIDSDAFLSLSCYCMKAEQEIAICYILNNSSNINEDDISEMIGRCSKDMYENAVRVLAGLGYPKVKSAIPSLFQLLQDLTWPGSTQAFQLLLSMPTDAYENELRHSIGLAAKNNDTEWATNLATFIEKSGISDAGTGAMS